jgi:hypothetical protein
MLRADPLRARVPCHAKEEGAAAARSTSAAGGTLQAARSLDRARQLPLKALVRESWLLQRILRAVSGAYQPRQASRPLRVCHRSWFVSHGRSGSTAE